MHLLLHTLWNLLHLLKGSAISLQDELEVKLAIAPERIHTGGSQRGDQLDAQVAAVDGGGVQRGTLTSCRIRGAPGADQSFDDAITIL